MASSLHIILAQINPVVGDILYNRTLIEKAILEAPPQTDIIVFPELALSGYPPEDLVLKPAFLAEIEQAAAALATDTRLHGKTVILPCPLRRQGKLYNAAHVIGGGDILATTLKHHLPNYGVFDEARVFSPGPMPAPAEIGGHKIGLMICEDMWFPDVAAHLKAQGAEILICVNASPFENGKDARRREQATARTAETALPLLYVNQCGGQDELVFDGGSFVMNADGTIAAQAAPFAEQTLETSWTKDRSGRWVCAAQDIAPPAGRTAQIYHAAMLGLRDYVGKNGFPGVLIGLSGGIDSALSAAIAVDALGAEKVHCVMMPSTFTSQESLEDAAACAGLLGVRYDIISIESAVAAFHDALAPCLKGNVPGTTFENIQPRCRGLILMALSNAGGKMVLSTGNKSEMAVGYATLYGDMCGGFNAIKDIYKTDVYELSRWRNAHKPESGLGPAGAVMPANILVKAPTAELKHGQTDQDTLPPYPVLDDILVCLIEKDMSPMDIVAKGHDRAVVAKVWKMLDAAEYKRRQAPPGVKITARAFGRDRRYPITSRFTKIIEN